MKRYPMKPETIERRKRERAADIKARHENLIVQLRVKAERDGPDSIWAEMLAEVIAR